MAASRQQAVLSQLQFMPCVLIGSALVDLRSILIAHLRIWKNHVALVVELLLLASLLVVSALLVMPALVLSLFAAVF